jgi:hypothetical protein
MCRLAGEMVVAFKKIEKSSAPFLIRINYLYFGLILATICSFLAIFGSYLAMWLVIYIFSKINLLIKKFISNI